MKNSRLALLLFFGTLAGCGDWLGKKLSNSTGTGFYSFSGVGIPLGVANSIQAPSHFAKVLGVSFAPTAGWNPSSPTQVAFRGVASVMPSRGKIEELNPNVLFAFLSIAKPMCDVWANNSTSGFWSSTATNFSVLNGTAVSASPAILQEVIQKLSRRAWGFNDASQIQTVLEYASTTAGDFDTRFPGNGRRQMFVSVCMMILVTVGSIGS